MAEIPVDTISDPGTFQPQWKLQGAVAGDYGKPVRIPQFSDKSFGMWGTWGGTVIIQGSWDKSSEPAEDSWQTITEMASTAAISATANAFGLILDNPVWIRPKCTVSTVANVNVTLNCTLAAGAR